MQVSIPQQRPLSPSSPAEGKTLLPVTHLGCALMGKALPEYCLSRPSRTSWRFWFNCKTQKQEKKNEKRAPKCHKKACTGLHRLTRH